MRSLRQRPQRRSGPTRACTWARYRTPCAPHALLPCDTLASTRQRHCTGRSVPRGLASCAAKLRTATTAPRARNKRSSRPPAPCAPQSARAANNHPVLLRSSAAARHAARHAACLCAAPRGLRARPPVRWGRCMLTRWRRCSTSLAAAQERSGRGHKRERRRRTSAAAPPAPLAVTVITHHHHLTCTCRSLCHTHGGSRNSWPWSSCAPASSSAGRH